jgi:hypothetical protein
LNGGNAYQAITNASGLVTLSAGYYWLASVYSSTPTTYNQSATTSANTTRFGSKSFVSGYNNGIIASEGNGFTLPATATNLRFIDYGGPTSAYCPIMEFRVL